MVDLDLRKLLTSKTERCAEVLELQHILKESKDGYFGIKTLTSLQKKFNRSDVALCQLKQLGVEVRSQIPNSEIWWMPNLEKEYLKKNISYHTLLGEFIGTLEGIVHWEIPKELEDKLNAQILDLRKRTLNG
jgi:hypothetical protein